MPHPLGSELWVLYFDAMAPRYVAHCLGVVDGYDRSRGYHLNGKGWQFDAYPNFGSQAEADAWIAAHPPAIPTIK